MRKNSLFKRGVSWFLSVCLIAGMVTVPVGAAGNTLYVSPTGDDTKDGLTEEAALLNIKTAYDKAEDGDTIVLLDNFDQPSAIGEFNDQKSVTIDGGNNTITYTGTSSIDTTSNGLFKVNSGAVTIENLTIDMDMHNKALSGRALYAGQKANVTLNNVTIENGSYVDGTQGGGAIYVHTGADVTVTDSTLSNNTSALSGGAIFVADGGELTVNGATEISSNRAKDGAGIYVANSGVFHLEGNAEITNNDADNAGGGVFLAQGSSNTVADNVIVSANTAASENNNVYLQNTESQQVTVDTSKVATLDCSALTSGANIGITCQNPNYYRLVSLPSGYDISKADEAGWVYDDGSYDIRLMTREGVTGLFLYYHTIPVSYDGTENLNPSDGITGKDINGEDIINYPPEIATDGNMGNNGPSSGDYTLDVKVDDSYYRIPESIDLTTKAGETLTEGVDYTWAPDYANGTGVITIKSDKLKAMQENGDELNVCVKGDQKFTLTLKLSDVDIDLNGWFENADDTSDVADAEISNKGYTVQYDTAANPTKGTIIDSRDNAPVSDALTVSLYEYSNGSSTLVGTTNTVGGHYDFSEGYTLDNSKSYFITFDYTRSNRVISKAYIQAEITSFPGHTIPDAAHVISGGITDADIQYTVHGDNTATLIIPRNVIKADTVISIGTVETGHTIYFDANGGVCTVPSKSIVEGVSAYGELPSDAETTRTGYTFLGWFTERVGGDEITASSEFTSTADVTLYAHWAPNGDRHYEIRQWVEFLDNGVNVGCDAGTQKVSENGTTYYLYQTDSYDNGVADADDMDISGLVMSVMSSADFSWWNRDGFNVNANSKLTGLHVNADGSSVYDIYYDRNIYDVTLDAGDNSEANGGNKTIESTTPDVTIKVPFGSEMGNEEHFDYSNDGPTNKPELPGYDFKNWADEDENVVKPDTIYTKTEDSTLHGDWTARTDTVYVVHYMLQNVGLNPTTNRIEAIDGEYVDCAVAVSVKHDGEGNYVGLESRDYYLADGTKLACYFGQSTTEGDVNITAPALQGFNFKNWKNSVNVEGNKDTTPVIHVQPNDASKKNDLTSDSLDVENLTYSGNLGELYLYYDRVSNEVIFNPGEGKLPDQTTGDLPYGGDYQGQFPDNPTRPGHDFTGWVDKEGNSVDEKTPSDKYTKEDGTIELFPTWKPRDYSLTYVIAPSADDGHSNSSFVPGEGGTASAIPSVENGYSDGRLVTYNSAVGTMPTNAKVGYTFQGWYLGLEPLNGEITSETIVTIDNVVIEDTVTPNAYEDTRPLYAYVTPNTYTITFNGGTSLRGVPATVPVATKDVVFDGPYGNPQPLPVPTLTGYTFQGWYLDPNDPNTLVQDDDIYTIPNNVTLYAKWTPNTYRYTFVLNDSVDPEGKGSTPATLTSNGINYNDPNVDETYDNVYKNAFEFEASRIGYTFDGWSLERNGEPLTPEAIVSIASDATLYACWTPKTYDVILNHNDGFRTGAADVVEVLNDALTFDAVYSLNDIVTADKTPSLTGYDFGGWATVRNNKSTIVTDANWIASQAYVTDSDLTLYATWFARITVDPDGGTFGPDSKDPFQPGSSTPTDTNTDDLTELPKVDKPGYTQDGWKDENGNKVTEDDLKRDNVPSTVKPDFKPNVTFNANGGSVNGSSTYTVKAESVTVLPTGVRSGYDFNGWYTEANGGTRLTLAEIQGISAPTTVYAHWTAHHSGGSSGGGGGGGGGGSVSRDYNITVKPSANGETTSNKKSAASGETVTITTKPDGSYKVDTITITDKKGNSVSYNETKNGFTFKMPSSDVTVYVTYKTLVGHILDTGDHREYIHGYTNGTVGPNRNMTRGEAAQMFYNLLLDKSISGTPKNFADVNDGIWCAKAIRVVSSKGIVVGYTDGNFGYDDPITRAQFATMCVRFLEGTDGSYTKGFADVKPGDWYYDYVMTAAEHGWVNGYSNGYFGPNDLITRAQVMTLMNHMLGREADKEYINANVSKLHDFSDLHDSSAWYYYDVVEATNGHDYDKLTTGEVWTGLRAIQYN